MTLESFSICDRLRNVRVRHYGERGRSMLCRELGIAPSTYSLYEVSRVPPVDLLVRVAELTGVRIEWLLQGSGEPYPADRTSHVPEAASSISAVADWIPIVGCTAAGTARYWEELTSSSGGAEADSLLEKKLADYVSRAGNRSNTPASLSSTIGLDRAVSLVQFSTPDDHGFLEFLSASGVKSKYPRAVAWRIDGESMTPRYLDGDFVVTSLDHPAVPGHPCVARQKGQIGVNCKIYQVIDGNVLLIPINESCPTQRFSASKLMWAQRVLCSVRLSR